MIPTHLVQEIINYDPQRTQRNYIFNSAATLGLGLSAGLAATVYGIINICSQNTTSDNLLPDSLTTLAGIAIFAVTCLSQGAARKRYNALSVVAQKYSKPEDLVALLQKLRR
ncbi:MAG: hypothetical protein Q8L34_04985 [Candidatus Woesearchaeota archaeon]|nr:hypothetical protein [Candidatus Woesearchaeota archaeon]